VLGWVMDGGVGEGLGSAVSGGVGEVEDMAEVDVRNYS
jgi:hypothetical protein